MRSLSLSPGEIARGRRVFSWFNVLNTASFQLLSGNIITLYALRLGAGNLLIGALAAFTSLSPVMVLAGRPLVPLMKATTLMGVFWIIRYLVLLPMLVSPAFALTGFGTVAVTIMTLAVLGFNIARGVAITTFNPILAELAGRKDRGEYLSFIQLLVNIVAPMVGVAMALLLGGSAPLGMYAVFFGVGIFTGLWASYLVFRLPEPREYRTQVSETLLATIRKAMVSRSFIRFTGSLSAVSFTTSMAGSFLIVFIKQVYAAGDSWVVVFTVIGGLGAIVMALASSLTIDRLGAKPLYFFFTAVATMSLVLAIASPPLPSALLLWLFSSAMFLLFTMGASGAANAAQTYFFSITSPKDSLNLGVLYQLVTGLSGAAGAFAGGAFLEWLERVTGWDAANIFRLFFGAAAALSVTTLLLVSSLENIGSYSIIDSIGIIFSPRDMRALSLLRKLGRSRSVAEEEDVIEALAESQSEVSIEQLISKLGSPRFIIRSAALAALRALPTDARVNRALIEDVERHPFTTAYMAAEMLGERGVRDSVPILRKRLASQDYFLSGKCMVSLARLGDRESIPRIREILGRTENPRLIIHGATAMEIFRDSASAAVLLMRMRRRTSRYLREELILCLAGILGMQDWFYPLFSSYLESPEIGIAHLTDYVENKQREMERNYSPLLELIGNAQNTRKEFVEHAVDILDRLPVRRDGIDLSAELMESIQSPPLRDLPRFRFFLACAIVWFYFNR